MTLTLQELTEKYEDYKWAFGEKPPKEELEYLYLTLNMTQKAIAALYKKGDSSVDRWLKHFNISRSVTFQEDKIPQECLNQIDWSKLSRDFRVHPSQYREDILEEDLRYLYIELNWTREDVATFFNLSNNSLPVILRKYDIHKSSQLHVESRMKANIRKTGTANPHASKEALEKKKKTNLERYGVDSILCKNEIKQKGMLKKYGVAHPQQVNQVREKTKNTFRERYGSDYYLQTDEFKEVAARTNLEKYGARNVFELKEFQEVAAKKREEKYGHSIIAKVHIHDEEHITKEFWMEKFVDSNRNAFDVGKCCEYHNITPSTVFRYLKDLNIEVRTKYSSIKELEIKKFLTDLDVTVDHKNRKIINPQELDLYLPDFKLAIEYDGLLFHSSGTCSKVYKNTEPRYHVSKTNKCEKQGVQLFHIFENEWLDPVKKGIWKSLITSKVKKQERIFARKTTVKKISGGDAYLFCETNHLQGGIMSLINYGLFYNEELVAVMTFNPPRYNNNYDWELIRYCSKKYLTVVGGASKLLSHFRKEHKGSIISYANRRWSTGGLYKALGFTMINVSPPNYFYFKTRDGGGIIDYTLYSRIKFQKHKLKELLKNYDPSLSEKENMFLNGYRAIYDCGNLVYVLS